MVCNHFVSGVQEIRTCRQCAMGHPTLWVLPNSSSWTTPASRPQSPKTFAEHTRPAVPPPCGHTLGRAHLIKLAAAKHDAALPENHRRQKCCSASPNPVAPHPTEPPFRIAARKTNPPKTLSHSTSELDHSACSRQTGARFSSEATGLQHRTERRDNHLALLTSSAHTLLCLRAVLSHLSRMHHLDPSLHP